MKEEVLIRKIRNTKRVEGVMCYFKYCSSDPLIGHCSLRIGHRIKELSGLNPQSIGYLMRGVVQAGRMAAL